MTHLGGFCIFFYALLKSAGVIALVWGTEGLSKAPWTGARQSSSKECGGAPCSLLQEREGQGDKEKWLEVTQLSDVTAGIEVGLPPTSFLPLKTDTLTIVSFRHL